MSEQYLTLEGANICYEVQGAGPYLILVPGANGDADIFKPLRAQLIDHFTVVLYDRRGFSRSVLTGPQDYTKRIDTDVDDIYKLMKSLTKDRFTIMGNSSGAMVTLRYLVTHSDTLAQCILHEPPLLTIMPNKQEHCEFQYKLYEIAKKEGKQAAMIQFAAKFCNASDGKLMMASQTSVNDQRAKNADYWFEHELRQYPTVEFDFEEVKKYHSKLILICGDLNKEVFIYQPITLLAKYVGIDCFEFPGGHLGFLTHSGEFATLLIESLKV